MSSKSAIKSFLLKAGFKVLILLVIMIAMAIGWNKLTSKTIPVIINSCERDGDKARWLVATDDEMFVIADQLTALRFRGRKIAQKLRVGGAYEIRVQNLAIFGNYRNIMEAEPANPFVALPQVVSDSIDALNNALRLSAKRIEGLNKTIGELKENALVDSNSIK